MKILIVVPDFDKVNFFLNLGIYLRDQKNTVHYFCRKSHLRNNFIRYGFEAYSNFNSNLSYDTVLFWNATNTFEKKYFESQTKTKCWYFENGYWQGETIQLNRGGVNFEADYANLSPDEILKFSYTKKDLHPTTFTPVIDQKVYVVPYAILSVKNIFIGNIKIFYKSISCIIRKKLAAFIFKLSKLEASPAGEFVFFPLQVNSDTQLIYNSPYESMRQVVGLLQKKMDKKIRIVIKKHPKEFEFYTIPQDERTEVYKKINLENAMLQSDYVITINSSVGFQALEKGKKVLHLGNSFYENFPGVVKCDLLKDNLTEKISELERLSVDWEIVSKLFLHFRHAIFIEGNWRKPDLQLMNKISERITS